MTLSENDLRSARILIVDDQAAEVHLLRGLLGEAGYSAVQSTMDPRQVCALHRAHDFDLVLLALQMPAMDSFQVMAELQAGANGDYLPVIVLTAQPEQKLKALQAGARDFISKPFDLLEVKTRIHNMLEVRLLYRRLEAHNELLEQTVLKRTAELRDSEARYRCLTELASDWYWEQDESGNFTKVSGPVLEMLGLRVDTQDGTTAVALEPQAEIGWDEAARSMLRAAIAAHRPVLDFAFNRVNTDGSRQQFRVSGEPMFSPACRFVGYRGIGVETTERPHAIAR